MASTAEAYAQQGLSVVKETALSRLANAVELLRKAEGLVSETSTRLVGASGPEGGAEALRGPIGSGIFGSVEELADNVTELASSIVSSIQRVERRL